MAGLDFPRLNQDTPESIVDDYLQRGLRDLQQRFDVQWDEVEKRGKTLGQRRQTELFDELESKLYQEAIKFRQSTQQQLEEFARLDRLAKQGGFDSSEAKWRMVLSPEAAAAKFPRQETPQTFEQNYASIQAHKNRLRRSQAEFFTDPGGQRIKDWKKFWFAEEKTRPTVYRRSYDPTDKGVYEFEGKRGLYKVAGEEDMQDLFQIQRELDTQEQLESELFSQPDIATRVRGPMLRIKRNAKHDSLTTQTLDASAEAQPKPKAPRQTVSGQQQMQPPVEHPDAVWNPEHKMWTIIQNERLVGIK